MELTYTVTLRVGQAGRDPVPAEYASDEYMAEFATQTMADRLMVVDARPFAENAINKLAVWATAVALGEDVTHEQPAPEGQAEAEAPRTLGFTSDQIAKARERNANRIAFDNPPRSP